MGAEVDVLVHERSAGTVIVLVIFIGMMGVGMGTVAGMSSRRDLMLLPAPMRLTFLVRSCTGIGRFSITERRVVSVYPIASCCPFLSQSHTCG